MNRDREILWTCLAALSAGAAAAKGLREWLDPRTQGEWLALLLWSAIPRAAVWLYLLSRDRRWRRAPLGFEGGWTRALGHGALLFSLWAFFLGGASGPAWTWPQRLGGAAVSFLAGGFEEFVYRGLILSAMLALLPRPWAVLASALAFTAAHFRPESIPAWPHIFLTGAVFANLRLRGLGLGWLALIHAVIDAAFFFVGYEGGPGGPRYALFVGGLFAYAALSFPAEGAPGFSLRPAPRPPGSSPSPG